MSGERKRVVITGATGTRNRGVEALLVPLLEHLRGLGDTVEASVLTRSPAYDEWRLGELGARFRQTGFEAVRGRAARLRRRGARALGRLDRPWRRSVDLIESADLVIATGGDVFGSDYGNLGLHLEPLRLARAAGVDVAMLGHSIGPFRSRDEADAWSAVARDSALVTLRERLSYDYVCGELGVTGDRVVHTADLAFLLEPCREEVVDRMASFYGVPAGEPLIAACPSQGIARYADQSPSGHRLAWRELLDWLVEALGAHVLLIPHVQEVNVQNDDRLFVTQLALELADSSRVRVIAGDHSAAELKGLIGRSELVLTERMHAAIAGLSSAIPTLPIGYSVKSRGIVGDMLGMADMVIPVETLIEDRPAVKDVVRRAWDERDDIGSRLEDALRRTIKAASLNLTLLDEVLASRCVGLNRDTALTPAPAHGHADVRA